MITVARDGSQHKMEEVTEDSTVDRDGRGAVLGRLAPTKTKIR